MGVGFALAVSGGGRVVLRATSALSEEPVDHGTEDSMVQTRRGAVGWGSWRLAPSIDCYRTAGI